MENHIDPLLIPIVLQNIFKHLHFSDRKCFRLVNKVWRDVILTQWRNSAVFILNSFENESFSVSQLQQFFEKPFRHYRLLQLELNSPNFSIRICNFLQNYGKNCLSLDLKTLPPNFLEPIETSPRINWLLLEACPNLLKLSLSINFPEYSNFHELFESNIKDLHLLKPQLAVNFRSLHLNTNFLNLSGDHFLKFKKLLNLFPNLTDLKLKGLSLTLISTLHNHLETTGKYIKLQSLELNLSKIYNNNVIFEQLRGYNSKLEKPSINNLKLKSISSLLIRLPFFKNPSPFTNFLQEISETLTKLEITFKNNINSSSISFLVGATLPNLTDLNINFSEVKCSPPVASEAEPECPLRLDFRCLIGKPNLRRFYCLSKQIFQEYPKKGLTPEQLFIQDIPDLLNLEEFSFYMGEKLDAKSVKLISSWMPALKKLAIVMDKETFSVAVEAFPKLEELTLFPNSSVPDKMIILAKVQFAKKLNIKTMYSKTTYRQRYF